MAGPDVPNAAHYLDEARLALGFARRLLAAAPRHGLPAEYAPEVADMAAKVYEMGDRLDEILRTLWE